MDKKIIIVDDEPRLLHSFKVLFENQGYSVTTALSGESAIELFRQNPVKVVISDIQMGEMDGLATMNHLSRIDPYIQFIFLTGYASVNNASEALKHDNAFDYIKKPIQHLQDLFQIVEKATEKYNRIIARHHKEKEHEKGFAVFKNIFDTMEAIVYVADMQTHELIYTNKKFDAVFRKDGKQNRPDEKCWQIIQKKQDGPCPFCTNNRLVHPDGSPAEPYNRESKNTKSNRWYSIVDQAIEWYDHRIVRLETALDITEKKEHEKLFKQFEKAIETQKKIESIGTLAGGVAHDINNTLSVILGNINLAQLTSPDNEMIRYLGKAEKGVIQAKDISAKLLIFAKGGGAIKKQINIKNLIQKVIGHTLDPGQVSCSFISEISIGQFHADEDQLENAFENIIQNAVEAMDGQGHIDISIAYMEHRTDHHQAHIQISDAGCGIPFENIDMIFNPYFTTKPLSNKKSTGLGLSIAWTIISRHGGNIHIESVPGRGTDVHIFLPVFIEQVPKSVSPLYHQSIPDPQPKRKKKTVLLMDDDPLTLDVISQLITRFGFRVIVTSNSNQAITKCLLEKAADRKIDLALLDYEILNGPGGFPTMQKIKKIDPEIKGILITAHAKHAETRKFKHHGFSNLLEKPFSMTQLSKAIDQIISE